MGDYGDHCQYRKQDGGEADARPWRVLGGLRS